MRDFDMLGFAIKDLASSQVAYELTYNANEWLRKNYRLNIALFYQEQWLASLAPEFAQYHMSEAVAFSGSLVATSLGTAFAIKNAVRAKRFFYINDLEYLRPNFNKEQWDDVMNDQSITKFARCNDYVDQLRDFGYEIDSRTVPSFEIDKILEITHGYDSK